MKHDRHTATTAVLSIVLAGSCGLFLRFEAPGMVAWLMLLFVSSLWMSMRSPGFKRAWQAWRGAYRNRSSVNTVDPEALA